MHDCTFKRDSSTEMLKEMCGSPHMQKEYDIHLEERQVLQTVCGTCNAHSRYKRNSFTNRDNEQVYCNVQRLPGAPSFPYNRRNSNWTNQEHCNLVYNVLKGFNLGALERFSETAGEAI